MDCEDAYVCSRCLGDDEGLASWILLKASSGRCSFCRRKSSRKHFAAPLSDVVERIHEGIREFYGQADDEGAPFESREGGYQIPVYDSAEVLQDMGIEFSSDRLERCVESMLPDQIWCKTSPYSLRREESLGYAWSDFCEQIKHRTRFLFFGEPEVPLNHDEIAPSQMLEALGEELRQVLELRTIKASKQLFRARVHIGQLSEQSIGTLGPPPTSAQIMANRMTAAGISVFYCALDRDTAIAETVSPTDEGKGLTVGAFQLRGDALVLDLSDLPQLPSLFADSEARAARASLVFLHEFQEEITKPIVRDGREHIEYVPSQVVTEYLRFRFRDRQGRAPNGIVYPSARKPNGKCCVLFVSAEDCIEEKPRGTVAISPIVLISFDTSKIP